MKSRVLFFCLALLCPSLSHAAEKVTTGLTQDEITLANLINEYRAANGLPAVPISASLSKVAQAHVWDSNQNHPDRTTDASGNACNAHSWSNNGPWTPFCYYNGAPGKGMWDKPRELSSYPGNGYEISAWTGVMNPQIALSGWQSSPAHNDVILNRGSWGQPWAAMGVGIFGGYAHVWFGREADPAGAPIAGAVNATPAIDPNRYYRLKNFQGEPKNFCLEGNQVGGSNGGGAFMMTCANVSGQQWKFLPVGGGYYRMTTRFLEANNKCLEGNQYPAGSLGGASFMDNCQSVSGQYWKVVYIGGHGYMQLTTMFRDPLGECLEANPGARMTKCSNLMSQLWRLEAL